MYIQGDWVTIKYGEYTGMYGKVTAVNRNGTYRVLPYNRSHEPGSMIVLDDTGLELLEPVVISRDELRKLARAELMYRDIADHIFPIFHIRAGQPYDLMPEDIVQALQNINQYPDCLGRFREWFWLIQNIFYEDLGIGKRYDKELFSDTPESEQALFSTVYSLTETLYWKLEERFVTRENTAKYVVRFQDEEQSWEDNTGLEEAAYKAVCEDIASRVRTFGINQEKPQESWIYSPSQKRHIINSYEDEAALMKAPAEERALYRRCVMDLYRQGDVQAMKILAWGYMEGKSVFRQSFRQAEKYLLSLYRKTGDPYAANSLGLIYSRGLIGNREPEPEKAFRYFSFGALAGIDESLYNLGNMLIHGEGTVRNIDMGMNLIVDGYRDTLLRFGYGEYDNRFAEYAYYMGKVCMENIVLGMGIRDACKFFLEADYAIRKRMERQELFGDALLRARIEQDLKTAQEAFAPDRDRSVLKADFPIYISHMFEDKLPIQITIGKDPKGYFLKMNRFRLIPGSEPALLVAFPELSYVNLVTELVFRLEDTGVIRTPDNSDTFLAEGFAKNDHTGALEFYAGGECVAAIEAKWFVIDVTKEKMLLKMSARKKKKR